MKHNRSDISRRFSQKATTYEEHANIQQMVADKIIALIPEMCYYDKILDVGCGTGILTGKLLVKFPTAKITALDIAPGMISQAKEYFKAENRIMWEVSDLLEFDKSKQFDCVVSGSALHWIHPIEKAFEKSAVLLKTGGYMICALMVEGTLNELRLARSKVAPHKVPLVSLPEPDDVSSAIEKYGFSVEYSNVIIHRIYFANTDGFLTMLTEQGLTAGAVSKATKQLNRSEISKLKEYYNKTYITEFGGVYASFKVMYCLLKKK